jgi:hypothetical protein
MTCVVVLRCCDRRCAVQRCAERGAEPELVGSAPRDVGCACGRMARRKRQRTSSGVLCAQARAAGWLACGAPVGLCFALCRELKFAASLSARACSAQTHASERV